MSRGSTDRVPTAVGRPRQVYGRSSRLGVAALALIGAAGRRWPALPGAAEAHGPVAPIASSYFGPGRSASGGSGGEGGRRRSADVAAASRRARRSWSSTTGARRTCGSRVRASRSTTTRRCTTSTRRRPRRRHRRASGRRTPPKWDRRERRSRVRAGMTAGCTRWRRSRSTPGASFVGPWRIPVRVDGRSSAISGGLWHAPRSVDCLVLADRRCCWRACWRRGGSADPSSIGGSRACWVRVRWSAIAVAGLGPAASRPAVGLGASACRRWRPFWRSSRGALSRVCFGRAGYFTYFAIAFVALWEGSELIPTLLNGFVLIALPAFVARAAAVVCLGTAAGLIAADVPPVRPAR